jgi:hypothetical protein
MNLARFMIAFFVWSFQIDFGPGQVDDSNSGINQFEEFSA